MTNQTTQAESATTPSTATEVKPDIGSLLTGIEPNAETPEKKVENKEDPNDRFARLAQLDKQQRVKDAEIKSKMKELAEREMKVKDQLELAALVEKDPLAYFKKRGIDVNKFYSDALNNMEVENDPTRKELQELKEWKQSVEHRERERIADLEQQNKSDLERKRGDYLDHLSGFIKTNEEKFPLLSSFDDSHKKVYDLIDEVYTQSQGKRVLTEEEACAELQNHLAEMYIPILNKKGVRKILKLDLDNSDTSNIESFLKPESGVTIDQTFKATANGIPPELSTEDQRHKAAVKLFEQMVAQERAANRT